MSIDSANGFAASWLVPFSQSEGELRRGLFANGRLNGVRCVISHRPKAGALMKQKPRVMHCCALFSPQNQGNWWVRHSMETATVVCSSEPQKAATKWWTATPWEPCSFRRPKTKRGHLPPASNPTLRCSVMCNPSTKERRVWRRRSATDGFRLRCVHSTEGCSNRQHTLPFAALRIPVTSFSPPLILVLQERESCGRWRDPLRRAAGNVLWKFGSFQPRMETTCHQRQSSRTVACESLFSSTEASLLRPLNALV